MGLDRCFGEQGHEGTQKQGDWGTFRVINVMIWVLWPGIFPRTLCFGGFDKKWCGWVQMCTYRVGWVRMDAGPKRETKKGKKSPKWVSSRCFEAYAHGEKSRKLAGMVEVVR